MREAVAGWLAGRLAGYHTVGTDGTDLHGHVGGHGAAGVGLDGDVGALGRLQHPALRQLDRLEAVQVLGVGLFRLVGDLSVIWGGVERLSYCTVPVEQANIERAELAD